MMFLDRLPMEPLMRAAAFGLAILPSYIEDAAAVVAWVFEKRGGSAGKGFRVG